MQERNASPLSEFFHNKFVLIFLIIDVIIIAALIGVLISQNTRVSTINFNVAPPNAVISVNGDSHYKNGQYDITPGTYTIEISQDGLETKTFSVDVGRRSYVAVTVFLSDADKTFEYYTLNANYDAYNKLKEIASAENNITTDADTSAEEFIARYNHILSIYDKLPIKGYVYTEPSVNSPTGGFSIVSGREKNECEKSSCLLVRYFGIDYENEVLEQIKEAGYDPGDYQLIYERRS